MNLDLLQFRDLEASAWALGIAGVVLGYATGSIPFGLLISLAKGMDIRKHGSGNIGATNVGRALGLRYGLLVFCLDFLKGAGPVLGTSLWVRSGHAAVLRHDLPVLVALAAVLGHTFSVWLGFRGGKAGATGLGVGAVLCWPAMLAAALVWCLTVWWTRYVSLGTILGSLGYLATYLFMSTIEAHPMDRQHFTLTVFCFAVAALVMVRHKSNIQRLRAGTESKI